MRASVILGCTVVLLLADGAHAQLPPPHPDIHDPAIKQKALKPLPPLFPPAIVDGHTAAQWHTLYLAQRHRTYSLKRTLIHRPSVTEAIRLSATVYHQSYWSMRRRAFCESHLYPYAHNLSGASGLFQVLYPSTWRTTPFSRFSPWSPYANALAAGYMLSRGRSGEWSCRG